MRTRVIRNLIFIYVCPNCAYEILAETKLNLHPKKKCAKCNEVSYEKFVYKVDRMGRR